MRLLIHSCTHSCTHSHVLSLVYTLASHKKTPCDMKETGEVVLGGQQTCACVCVCTLAHSLSHSHSFTHSPPCDMKETKLSLEYIKQEDRNRGLDWTLLFSHSDVRVSMWECVGVCAYCRR